jgi:HEAT repeat protein
MAKAPKLEALMAALREIRSEPVSEAGQAVLHQVLASKHSVAVAQATSLIGQFELTDFVPALIQAFDRFLIKAADSDPGCRAKQAIADTLYRLDIAAESLFLKGIRHVQREPLWGGTVDTAPRLRGACALGLVRMNYSQVMVELGDLLADPESEARIGAVRAIAYTQNDQGVPLLRLRIKVGDTSAVISECLIALLQLDPESSLPLVRSLLFPKPMLDAETDISNAEAAALALSEARLPEAFPILKAWWESVSIPELRKTGLWAISTLRQPEAIAFLLSVIADGQPWESREAIKAMGLYAHDSAIWQQVCQVVEARKDFALKPTLEEVSKSVTP